MKWNWTTLGLSKLVCSNWMIDAFLVRHNYVAERVSLTHLHELLCEHMKTLIDSSII